MEKQIKSYIKSYLYRIVSIARIRFQNLSLPAVLVLFGITMLASELRAQTTITSDGPLERVIINGKVARRFSDNVRMNQPEREIFCQVALNFEEDDLLKAYGGVRIVEKSGATIEGDTLYFYKKTNKVIVVGHVIMNDNGRILETEKLYYDTKTQSAWYNQGGKVTDQDNTLTSQYGRYQKLSDMLYFRGNVFLKNAKYTLSTDSLEYGLSSKLALFFGFTKIISDDGTLISTKGEYNMATQKARFFSRTTLETLQYYMIGDKVSYDKENRNGSASGNVVLYSRKDSLIISGQQARYSDTKGFSKVWGGRPIMKLPQKGDTLYLRADTLLTIEQIARTGPPLPNSRRLLAYHNARLYKADLQASADSMAYSLSDSAMRLFGKPVVWQSKNQISADTIRVQLANNAPERVYLYSSAFMISLDTLNNHNQIKGKNMTAYFAESKIRRIDVDGNGQSIYFALEGDSVLTGMNKTICSNMIIRFKEKNKLSSLTFLKKPEAQFIPPHEIEEPEKRLRGFKWRANERPLLSEFMNKKAVKAKPKKSPKKVLIKKPIKAIIRKKK